MGIKSKKTNGLNRHRDTIEIVQLTLTDSPMGGSEYGNPTTIYNDLASVERLSTIRLMQYGFENTQSVYQIKLNNFGATFNQDDSYIMYNGIKLKIHYIKADDENLGQKLIILAYGT